jgi:hypothetical protein
MYEIIKLDTRYGDACCIRKNDISVITRENGYTTLYLCGGAKLEVKQELRTVLEIMKWVSK